MAKLNILLILATILFFMNTYSQQRNTKNYALIVGGGCDEGQLFSPMKRSTMQWNSGLKRMGWETTVMLGNSKVSDPSIPIGSRKLLINTLKAYLNNVQVGDHVLIRIDGHGGRFFPVALNDRITMAHSFCVGNDSVFISTLVRLLKKIDKKNGDAGKVLLFESDCYSGNSYAAIKSSDICFVSSVPKNKALPWGGHLSEFGEILMLVDAKQSALTGDVLIESIKRVKRSFYGTYTNGFGIEGLNVNRTQLFIDRFLNLFPDYHSEGISQDQLLHFEKTKDDIEDAQERMFEELMQLQLDTMKLIHAPLEVAIQQLAVNLMKTKHSEMEREEYEQAILSSFFRQLGTTAIETEKNLKELSIKPDTQYGQFSGRFLEMWFMLDEDHRNEIINNMVGIKQQEKIYFDYMQNAYAYSDKHFIKATLTIHALEDQDTSCSTFDLNRNPH